MSIAAMQWAKQRQTGSATTKLVLLVLADYATPGAEDGTGGARTALGRHYAFAGQERVARECEMSVESVRRHQTVLAGLGLIRKEKRFDRAGNRLSDFIILAVDDHTARPFPDADQSADSTTGQSDRWSPVPGGPPVSSDRVTTSPEPPEDPPTSGQAPEGRIDRAALVADVLLEHHGSKISIDRVALISLLRPAVANGVATVHLLNAVPRLLADGQKLAPWTLQEYVGKSGSTKSLGFVQ